MSKSEYKEEQIKFLNKQLLEVCIKIGNSKYAKEYKMLKQLQAQYKKLIEYYSSEDL
jgi:hypothetical protein